MATPTKTSRVKTPSKEDLLVPPSVEELEQMQASEESSNRRESATPELDLSNENAEAEKHSPEQEPTSTISTEVRTQELSVVLEKIDSSLPSIKKKRVRKRKSKRAPDAPKFPLTGYVRYINDRREVLKSEHPEYSHLDITKKLADEWLNLPEDKKKPFLQAADKDRERYVQEMKDYNVMHPPEPKKSKTAALNDSKLSNASDSGAKESVKKAPLDVAVSSSTTPSAPKAKPAARPGTTEIQIFTDEFLEHNKEIEGELKTLRKSHTDYELQNSNLERYIENMKNGIESMNNESAILKTKNTALEKYLNKLKAALASALSSLSLPAEKGASVANIDNYMTELAKLTAPPGIINKAKDSIRKLDLQSLHT